MIRRMPAEAFIAAAILDLNQADRTALDRAARYGNWLGRADVPAGQPAEEMVMDAIVSAFRCWCRDSFSVPFSVREIFERIYSEASDQPTRRTAS